MGVEFAAPPQARFLIAQAFEVPLDDSPNADKCVGEVLYVDSTLEVWR